MDACPEFDNFLKKMTFLMHFSPQNETVVDTFSQPDLYIYIYILFIYLHVNGDLLSKIIRCLL